MGKTGKIFINPHGLAVHMTFLINEPQAASTTHLSALNADISVANFWLSFLTPISCENSQTPTLKSSPFFATCSES